MITLCGTGHRPDKMREDFYDPDDWLPAIDWLSDFLESYAISLGHPVRVISGMAIGFDMMLAVATLKLRDKGLDFQLLAAVPFSGQEKRWSPKQQQWYRAILEQADEVVCVSEEAAKIAFLQRNCWMVDHSDWVLAFHDGTRGGTKHCVDYANERGKKLVNIYHLMIDVIRQKEKI